MTSRRLAWRPLYLAFPSAMTSEPEHESSMRGHACTGRDGEQEVPHPANQICWVLRRKQFSAETAAVVPRGQLLVTSG